MIKWSNDEGCYRAWRLLCRLNTIRLSGMLTPEERQLYERLTARAEAIMYRRIFRYLDRSRWEAIMDCPTPTWDMADTVFMLCLISGMVLWAMIVAFIKEYYFPD